MKVLAVNTATTVLSLALTEGGKTVQSFESRETRDQGNLLLRHVRAALDAAGWKFDDLGLLAVVTGPGSFTGIRIGLATARALAMAAKLPIVGVSSFDIFAAPEAGKVNLIAVESWREELYFEGRDKNGTAVIPPINVTPEDFAKMLGAGTYVISGDAAQKLQAVLPGASVSSYVPAAGDIARVGEKMFSATGSQRPVPYYLREADVTIAKTKA
jgi:tRNA threonylcarbamoyladenosine biosynthesis protein TsaB